MRPAELVHAERVDQNNELGFCRSAWELTGHA